MNLIQPKLFFSCVLCIARSNAFNTNPSLALKRNKELLHHFSPYSTLSSRTVTDKTLSQAALRRITSLSARDTTTARHFSTKDRSQELKRLASTMDLDVKQLKEMLTKQRSKMSNEDEKAKYVDWILTATREEEVGKPIDAAFSAFSEEISEEKKMDDMNAMEISNSDTSAPKKKRAVRPMRPTANPNEETMDDDSVSSATGADPSLLSNLKFKDLDLHHNTKKALIETLKLETMTEIQSKTFTRAAGGTDVLGRARTGTGKTLAFLLPALESLLSNPNFKAGQNVGVLIVSPTRELASQIGDQAEKLITYHKNLSCQVVYGGTKIGKDVNAFNKRMPSFLIATPGRLLDHLENTKLNNGSKFGYDVMRDTPILVLDEADRLLEMGFRQEIKKIMAYLPKKEKRQTLLFSATVPKELKSIMAENMKTDYIDIDCIHDGGNNPDGGTHTNSLVKQSYTVLPSIKNQVTAVVQLVQEQMNSDPKHKVVVFFPTARMVGYFAEFFNLGLGIEVIEIHSKKSQGYRNKASDKFRKCKSGVLFTSDVSARGVDYPDVTAVLQFGLPESREQYIHRLGRTGRAGKEGQGILVLAPFEANFVKELTNIDISENKEATKLISSPIDSKIEQDIEKVLARIRSGDGKLTLSAEQSYQAFLGYYRGHMRRTTIRSKDSLVDTANTLAKVLGLKEQPGLTQKTVGKMGLKGIKNIRIISEADVRAKKGR